MSEPEKRGRGMVQETVGPVGTNSYKDEGSSPVRDFIRPVWPTGLAQCFAKSATMLSNGCRVAGGRYKMFPADVT